MKIDCFVTEMSLSDVDRKTILTRDRFLHKIANQNVGTIFLLTFYASETRLNFRNYQSETQYVQNYKFMHQQHTNYVFSYRLQALNGKLLLTNYFFKKNPITTDDSLVVLNLMLMPVSWLNFFDYKDTSLITYTAYIIISTWSVRQISTTKKFINSYAKYPFSKNRYNKESYILYHNTLPP